LADTAASKKERVKPRVLRGEETKRPSLGEGREKVHSLRNSGRKGGKA